MFIDIGHDAGLGGAGARHLELTQRPGLGDVLVRVVGRAFGLNLDRWHCPLAFVVLAVRLDVRLLDRVEKVPCFASIATACRDGGINKIHTVDHHIKNILGIWAEWTTMVTGE